MSFLEFELVVPCYNESDSLATLVKWAVEAACGSGYQTDRFKLVLVNNGSTDASKTTLNALKQGEFGEWLRIVDIPINQGYGYGLWQGLKSTTAKYVGWTHADLQSDPLDAFKALEKLKQYSDKPKVIVKGRRIARSWSASCQSLLAAMTASIILNMHLSETTAVPKVFNRAFLNCIIDPPNGYQFDVYAMFRAKKMGYNILTIPVYIHPRKYGTSHWALGIKSKINAWQDLIGYCLQIRRHP